MEKQRKLKAALYIRVSTEEQAQDGQSASAQAETLKQYCKAFDIEVGGIYEDLGLSGKSLKARGGLERLICDCARDCFDMVVVWKISRLSRNLKDLLYLIDVFEGNNVHFASCSEKFDTSTPVGRMTLQLLGSIAEFERNTIVENVKLGLRELARKGGKAASLLGYDNADRKLVVNEQEADIIRLIFSLYTENRMSFSSIAKQINSLGCTTKRGGEFNSSSISYILRNPAYAGINRHQRNKENEYCISGAHQAIIDEATWNMAQSISRETRRRKADTHADCSLNMPVICMRCNSSMKVFYAFSKGKKYKYMRCRGCSNYVNYTKLENKVVQELTSIIKNDSCRAALYHVINPVAYDEYTNTEISSIDNEIKRMERSKARYMRLFENYKLSEPKAFIDRIEEIENQIRMLAKKKLECIGKCDSVNEFDFDKYCAGLVERLSIADPAAVRLLSDRLIKSIGVLQGKIEMVLYP